MGDEKSIDKFLEIIMPNLNPDDYKVCEVQGLDYDMDNQSVLSFRDKNFRAFVNEFYIHSIKPFIEYLLSGSILTSMWNHGGYSSLKFKTREGEEKQLSGNHGMSEIIDGIRDGKFDVSEVIHDLAVLYRGSGQESKEEREQFYKKIKDVIKEGITVEVLVEK